MVSAPSTLAERLHFKLAGNQGALMAGYSGAIDSSDGGIRLLAIHSDRKIRIRRRSSSPFLTAVAANFRDASMASDFVRHPVF